MNNYGIIEKFLRSYLVQVNRDFQGMHQVSLSFALISYQIHLFRTSIDELH